MPVDSCDFRYFTNKLGQIGFGAFEFWRNRVPKLCVPSRYLSQLEELMEKEDIAAMEAQVCGSATLHEAYLSISFARKPHSRTGHRVDNQTSKCMEREVEIHGLVLNIGNRLRICEISV